MSAFATSGGSDSNQASLSSSTISLNAKLGVLTLFAGVGTGRSSLPVDDELVEVELEAPAPEEDGDMMGDASDDASEGV